MHPSTLRAGSVKVAFRSSRREAKTPGVSDVRPGASTRASSLGRSPSTPSRFIPPTFAELPNQGLPRPSTTAQLKPHAVILLVRIFQCFCRTTPGRTIAVGNASVWRCAWPLRGDPTSSEAPLLPRTAVCKAADQGAGRSRPRRLDGACSREALDIEHLVRYRNTPQARRLLHRKVDRRALTFRPAPSLGFRQAD